MTLKKVKRRIIIIYIAPTYSAALCNAEGTGTEKSQTLHSKRLNRSNKRCEDPAHTILKSKSNINYLLTMPAIKRWDILGSK